MLSLPCNGCREVLPQMTAQPPLPPHSTLLPKLELWKWSWTSRSRADLIINCANWAQALHKWRRHQAGQGNNLTSCILVACGTQPMAGDANMFLVAVLMWQEKQKAHCELQHSQSYKTDTLQQWERHWEVIPRIKQCWIMMAANLENLIIPSLQLQGASGHCIIFNFLPNI